MLSKLTTFKISFHVFLFISFSLSMFLRIYHFIPKNSFHVDENYSYIISTNNLSNFNNIKDMPAMTGEDLYNRFLDIPDNQKGNYKVIMTDTAHDTHPPLYYILLHSIIWWIGGGISSKWHGFLLNIFLFTATFLFFFRLSQNLLQTKSIALICTLYWAVSKGAIYNTLFDRMYEMLTLFIVLSVLFVFSAFDKEKPIAKDYISYSMILIFGFLTHYYYLFFILFLSFVILFNYRNKREVILLYIVTTISSFVISNLIFPFTKYIVKYSDHYRKLHSSITKLFFEQNIIDQLKHFISNLDDYIKLIISITFYKTYSVYLLLSLVIFFIIWKKYINVKIKLEPKILYIFLLVILFTSLLAFSAPFITWRYIAPILPLVFILIAKTFEFMNYRLIQNIAISIVGLTIIYGSFYGVTFYDPKIEAYRDSKLPIIIIYSIDFLPLTILNKSFIKEDKTYIFHEGRNSNIKDIYNNDISKFEKLLLFLSGDKRTHEYFRKLIYPKYEIIDQIDEYNLFKVYKLRRYSK